MPTLSPFLFHPPAAAAASTTTSAARYQNTTTSSNANDRDYRTVSSLSNKKEHRAAMVFPPAPPPPPHQPPPPPHRPAIRTNSPTFGKRKPDESLAVDWSAGGVVSLLTPGPANGKDIAVMRGAEIGNRTALASTTSSCSPPAPPARRRRRRRQKQQPSHSTLSPTVTSPGNPKESKLGFPSPNVAGELPVAGPAAMSRERCMGGLGIDQVPHSPSSVGRI